MEANDDLLAVDKPPSIEELVIAKLRKAIVTAQIKPGESLDQEELARRLGVSRTPVRQALRALAAENLVTFYPRRGAVVVELSIEEIEEIFLIREMLEPPAACLGAERATPQVTSKLTSLHERMCAITDDPLGWLALDREFHIAIYQQSGHPRLVNMIEALKDDINRYVRAYIDIGDNISRSNTIHKLILDAFAARDGESCRSYQLQHLPEVFAHFKTSLLEDHQES